MTVYKVPTKQTQWPGLRWAETIEALHSCFILASTGVSNSPTLISNVGQNCACELHTGLLYNDPQEVDACWQTITWTPAPRAPSPIGMTPAQHCLPLKLIALVARYKYYSPWRCSISPFPILNSLCGLYLCCRPSSRCLQRSCRTSHRQR